MDERSGARVVQALVPLSEMFGYVGDLRSRRHRAAPATRMQFDSLRRRFRQNVATEIIAKAKGE
jgi:elongation factor G